MTKEKILTKIEVLKGQQEMLSRICKARSANDVADLVIKEADRIKKESDQLNSELEKIL